MPEQDFSKSGAAARRQRGSPERLREDLRRSGQGTALGVDQTNRSAAALSDQVALRTQQQEKARFPDHNPRTLDLAMQVRVPMVDNAPSFNDAIDRAAFSLANDGWSIESVSQCAMVGKDDHGYAYFQIVVTATRS